MNEWMNEHRLLLCESKCQDHQAVAKSVRGRPKIPEVSQLLLYYLSHRIYYNDITTPCLLRIRLDDQAVFWHIMRTSSDPEILPLGKCGPTTHYYNRDSAVHTYSDYLPARHSSSNDEQFGYYLYVGESRWSRHKAARDMLP